MNEEIKLLGPFDWFQDDVLRDEPGVIAILSKHDGSHQLLETLCTPRVQTEAARALATSRLRKTNEHLEIVVCYSAMPEQIEAAVRTELLSGLCQYGA